MSDSSDTPCSKVENGWNINDLETNSPQQQLNFVIFIFRIDLFADIDECALEKHSCSSNGECANMVGSYQCMCKPKFTGDGITCQGEIFIY